MTGDGRSFSSGFSFCCSLMICNISSEPTLNLSESTLLLTKSTRAHEPILLDSIIASRTERVCRPIRKHKGLVSEQQNENCSLHNWPNYYLISCYIKSFLWKVIGKFLVLNNKIWTMAWDNEENIKNNNNKTHKLSIEVQFELGFKPLKATNFNYVFR